MDLNRRPEETDPLNDLAQLFSCYRCFERVQDDVSMCPFCSKIICCKCMTKWGQRAKICPVCHSSFRVRRIVNLRWAGDVSQVIRRIEDQREADKRKSTEEIRQLALQVVELNKQLQHARGSSESSDVREAIRNSWCVACKKIKHCVLCPRCSRRCCHHCINSVEIVQRGNNYICPNCHAGLAISDSTVIPRVPAIGSGVGADEDDEITILQEISVRTGNGSNDRNEGAPIRKTA